MKFTQFAAGVALVKANACPNDYWELNESNECVPKQSEYQIECDPYFGMTISVNGGVLFDDFSKISPGYMGSYVRNGSKKKLIITSCTKNRLYRIVCII